jgi:hypothetical protein
LTRALLAARRDFVVPLAKVMSGDSEASFDDGILRACWRAGDQALHLVANLSDAARPCPAFTWHMHIWGRAPPVQLPPWSVYAGIGGT